ncbi:hypothetical protein SBADM41S_01603 [Streptomyces badius]
MAFSSPLTSATAGRSPAREATAVARATAARGAGTIRTRAGSFGHSSSIATVPAPRPKAVRASSVRDDVRRETGEPGQLGETAARLFEVGHGVHLAQHDDQTDAGEHPLHHGDGDGAEPATEARQAQHDLEQSGREHDRAERAQAELLDGFEDEDGESGGRAADLEFASGEEADDESADDAGDQAQFGRDSGGDGDADAQRQRDQEDDE